MVAPTRRALLKSGLAGVAALNSSLLWTQETPPPKRNGRIHQSVCRWCYKDISTDQLSAYAARIGLSGVDLLKPEEYDIPRRYGLVCTMALIPGVEIPEGFNRIDNHAALEAGLRKYLPIAAKAQANHHCLWKPQGHHR